ncbi:FAD-binding oxidoreductase [Streptacidiphilus sp. ASG 303]|uniref:FAD-binding oxidoreductase n=1 Tax=Streptacidiphilus sp. ASG 303 TaxID=2896847 RepID=UPI001E64A00B|nr:FAD-binding oxidoreductase [Streptacidiphilus sp. ASG 303]MCD0480867.1 FAD-binding oxidoreductase [Streptacidiphilus sp. ASG 303]
MAWNGWGDPSRAAPLPDAAVGLLRDLLGVRPAAAPPLPLDGVAVAPTRLTGEALEAFARAAGGAEHVRTDDESRIRHTRGRSTPDLLRIRRGDTADAPDAVVLPGGHDEVLAVLRACTALGVAAVPFGGGTSVVGGLAPRTAGPFVAVDLRRLDRLVSLDPVSRTAVLEGGLRAPAAEALLNAEGFTLGHFPQSFEWASIGGFAAARSSGQASAGYGRFDEMVVGLTVATPRGTLELGRAPRSAAGPDLRQLVLGSEGAFGVVTSVRVQVRPVPEARLYEGWRFASFAAGTAALRRLAQDGPRPTVLRLSDEAETAVGLAEPDAVGGGGAAPGGCLAVLGYEGTAQEAARRRAEAAEVLRACGGEPLGEGPGRGWEHGRYAAPYLRDALLDAGAFAETLETAGFWAGLPALYDAVRTALTTALAGAGTPPLVMCHVSHVYPAGASLYFTVVSAQGADDPVAHWAPAKRAACDAIAAAGGTISHHHGVGTDHLAWYAEEVGPLGVEVLRAVKDRLDPAGILNPGVLVPSS